MDTALIVCGALAREVIALKKKHNWEIDILGVPSLLHNTPERIPPAVHKRINQAKQKYRRLIVVYGDCGTAGDLDRMLQLENVQRIAGPHCYEMYADGKFDQIMAEAPGTFFLTDYLVQSFDHLVIHGLGIDEHPELLKDYFRNYTRVVYLAQRDDPELVQRAHWAAEQLKLPLVIIKSSYGQLESRLEEFFKQP
jgi:Protein of unknown function (DUF1638)